MKYLRIRKIISKLWNGRRDEIAHNNMIAENGGGSITFLHF